MNTKPLLPAILSLCLRSSSLAPTPPQTEPLECRPVAMEKDMFAKYEKLFPYPIANIQNGVLRYMYDAHITFSNLWNTLISGEVSEYIDKIAEENSIPANLIRAIIVQETKANPCAISVAGARGIMQLMPPVRQKFRVDSEFDYRENIRGGVELLKELFQRYRYLEGEKKIEIILAAYNAGIVAVERCEKKNKCDAPKIPNYPETRQHVKNVIQYYKWLQRVHCEKE